jgi:hypothetical protein
MRGYRYCEAVAAASAFGWYIDPPLSFSLVWDGVEIAWTYAGAEDWYPLRRAQFPGFRQLFEQVVPDSFKPFAAISCRLARARRCPDLERLSGAHDAGLGIAHPGSAQHSAVPGLEHFEA